MSGGIFLFIFLVIWDLTVSYSRHKKPSLEISLNIHFGLISKRVELLLISFQDDFVNLYTLGSPSYCLK